MTRPVKDWTAVDPIRAEVWLVWEPEGSYRPELLALCHTREQAVAWCGTFTGYPPGWEDDALAIEGRNFETTGGDHA